MGKLSAIQRIEQLADRNSFKPFHSAGPSFVIAGEARLEGRPFLICAIDHESGEQPADLVLSIQRLVEITEAAKNKSCPLVTFLDAPGHAHTSGGKTPLPLNALHLHVHPRGVGRWYSALAQLSGEVPRVCALFGITGASTIFPVALTDIAIMMEDSGVCIGRPDAVKTMLGQTASFLELGGARMHCERSGLGDVLVSSELDAIEWTSRYMRFFPSNRKDLPLNREPVSAASAISPDECLVDPDPTRPFDMHPLIESFIDKDTLLELKSLYAKSAITALARVEGRVVGIVASNSIHMGGVLFPETCAKICRFLSICDAFSIPVVFLADTPGFMIGKEAEQAGIIKSAGMLFSSIANLSVPKLCIVVRNAHTAGLYAMSGPGFEPAQFLALPTAVITVFGRTAIERFAADRELSDAARSAIEEMKELSRHPELLVKNQLLDAVIGIHDLRPRIHSFLVRMDNWSRESIPRPVFCV